MRRRAARGLHGRDSDLVYIRTLQLNGAAHSLHTWGECVWEVKFPLLDTLSPLVRRNALTPPSSPDTATVARLSDALVSS